MNLFNVSLVTGCYARMTDIYTKLGEMRNVMSTLKEIVKLRKNVFAIIFRDLII